MAFPVRGLPPDVIEKLDVAAAASTAAQWAGLPTKLEVAVSARNPQQWPTLRHNLLGLLPDAAATPRSEAVAVEIMEALLDARLHRCVPLPDVMIASLAVISHLTVLHHDRDFDRIDQVYGKPAVEWLAL